MTTVVLRRLRRAGLVVLALLFVVGGAVAGLPWIVAVAPGHRVLAAYANWVLAPGSIEFGAIETSWFSPAFVHNVTLRDSEGDAVLVAPTLEFSWTLWQILAHRPGSARVELTGAKLDIERRDDGTIDLQETLRPIVPEHPKVRMLIHLEKSHLRLRDSRLGEPVLADDLTVDLDMTRNDEPIAWKISMTTDDQKTHPGRLDLEGTQSRTSIDHAGRHDFRLALKGSNWPFAVARVGSEIKFRGIFDGTIEAHRQSDSWRAKSETKISRFELNAPGLAKPIRLDVTNAAWDVSGTDAGWMVDQLSLESSLGTLSAQGRAPAMAERGARLDATINLADLEPYLPAALRPPPGARARQRALRLQADLKRGALGMTQECDVRGTVSDLIAAPDRRVLAATEPAADAPRLEPTGELVLKAHATYDPQLDRLDLAGFGIRLPFIGLEGTGSVRDMKSARQLSLEGTLNPDWDRLTALLAERVEPKARISGRQRPWRLSASIARLDWGDMLDSLSGDLGIQIDELDVFGLRLGRSVVAARAASGKVRLDPIDSTLNEGALHIEPSLTRDAQGQIWLRLDSSSHLDGAVINDEVSHRVLSYAAPVLDGATRVRGRISARLGEAVFPLTAPSPRATRVRGDLILDNVRFLPGSFAEQLVLVVGRQDQPLLTLRDSIAIRIEDGKVHQKGLDISLADLAAISLDGSVDFDKNLDLVATLAMNRSAPLADALPALLQNARVEIPVRGTMQHPAIDTTGLKDRLASMGIDFVGNSVVAGLDGLQRALEGKSLKGLGDYFLPRLRPMFPPANRAKDGSKAKDFPQSRSVPANPEPDRPGAARNGDKDEPGQ
jgi:hypothetical protein